MTRAERIRLAGTFSVVGGVLWVLVLLADVVAHDAIYDRTSTYRLWEALLIVVQLLLLGGVMGLVWSVVTGDSRLGRIGLSIALLGRLSFVIGEIRSFARTSDDEVFVPLGAMLTGIGMLLVGIAAVRAQRWPGWRRYLPLATGLYPFVAMFPIIALTGEPSTLAIALWGLLWLGFGFVLHEEGRARPWTQPSTPLPVYS